MIDREDKSRIELGAYNEILTLGKQRSQYYKDEFNLLYTTSESNTRSVFERGEFLS